jgi:hypothetical protein
MLCARNARTAIPVNTDTPGNIQLCGRSPCPFSRPLMDKSMSSNLERKFLVGVRTVPCRSELVLPTTWTDGGRTYRQLDGCPQLSQGEYLQLKA